jgi:hypothetical protein
MMATKQDFSEAEWETLRKAVTGSGMLVSLSDRDLSDSFGEAGAMAKYLAGQQMAAPSELLRSLAKTKGTGFGIGSSPDKVRDETLAALKSSVELLTAKAPDEVDGFRALVIGMAEAVAEAKHGTSPVEAQAEGLIREALGA